MSTRTLLEAVRLLSLKGFLPVSQRMVGVEHHETYGWGIPNLQGAYPVQIVLRDYGDGFWTITSLTCSDKKQTEWLHALKLALMKLPRYEGRVL
jgi:hypothetical protein